MNDCLTDTVVADLVAGLLQETRRQAVERHLERCRSCHDRVSRLAQGQAPTATGTLDSTYGRPPGGGAIGPPLTGFPDTSRFEFIRGLGAGGMGIVYAAHDHQRGCLVALKTVRAATPEALRRLRSEFLALHDLVHPNLVTLGELLDEGGMTYFTMELIDGIDFIRHVRPDGTLDPSRLRSAIRGLVAGLAFLHAAGTVHRDLKPSNVLVAGDRVVLLDFGLAVPFDYEGLDMGGTLAYMAPEQGDSPRVTPAADWYALGVVLAEALLGRLPFAGSPGQIAAAKRRGPPDDLAAAEPRELAQLAVRLLDPAPGSRPTGDEVARAVGASVPAAPTRVPFVGRARELAQLDEAWLESRRRVVRLVVTGPSGVGKTALIQRFADSLRDRGALVAAGRCYERMAVPYKTVHGVVAAVAGHLRADPGALAAVLATPDAGFLAGVFPPFAEVPELVTCARIAPSLRDPQQLRRRVFDAFRAAIHALAARAPLAIVVDDLQWADRDGLALLEHVIAGHADAEGGLAGHRTPTAASAAGDRPPFLILVAARDELPAGAAWLAAPGGMRLAVGSLLPDDAEHLARSLSQDASHTAAIVREADGHPLYIAELVRHHRGGAVDAPRLDEAIRSRVTALPAEQLRLLELVSLTGAPLPQRLVRDGAQLDGGAFWSAVAALRADHLVRTQGPGPGETIEPYHDRVRESVAAQLAPEARRDHHRRLAAVLEADAVGAANPGLLAGHLEAAGERPRASLWTERAAEVAVAALAFDRAAELYQRALELGGDDGGDRAARLQIGLGDALANAGRGAPAAAAYLAAVREATRPDEALELRRQAAEQLLRAGHAEPGLELLNRVLRQVGLPAASHRRWPLAALLWQRLRLRLRLMRPPARPRQRPRDARRLACCWAAMVGTSTVSRPSMEYQTRYLRLALAAGDRRSITVGMAWEGVLAAVVSGPLAPRARALLAATERWASESDAPIARAHVDVAHGVAAFLSGRWRDAQERFEAAERRLREECRGGAWEIATIQRVSLSCLWMRGRFAEMRRRVVAALRDAEVRGDRYACAQLYELNTYVLLIDDRADEARDDLARVAGSAEERLMPVQLWHRVLLNAQVALYAGDPVAAVRHLEHGLPAVGIVVRRVKMHRTVSYGLRGTAYAAAAAAGTGRDAARWARCAEQDWRRLRREGGRPVFADLLGAQLALLRGDRAGARRLLGAVVDGCAAVDMGLLGAAARWRLAQVDGDAELQRRILGELSADGVACPERMLTMMAPVPA